MNFEDIDELRRRFSVDRNGCKIEFSLSESGLPLIEVMGDQADALVCIQGAHLMSWRPKGEGELIWMSETARPLPGKSMRGGIPVCWPWFGAHDSNDSYPAHGFARTTMWQLDDVAALASGEVRLIFRLDMGRLDEEYRRMWPYDTVLTYEITVGRRLDLQLCTQNNSQQRIEITQALHSYFHVGDIRRTRVHGLEDKDYLDKPDGFKRKHQQGSVVIDREVDRIYLHTDRDIIIDNGRRQLRISGKGSYSTVVWNPWKTVAEKMADLGADGYLHMLCVETANAADDRRTIEPGGSHSLQACYELTREN